jgi:suppressor for copper-sensitivity B
MKARFWQMMVAAACVACASTAAQAQESAWVSADYAQVRLIAGEKQAGLDVRLAPGWHAYWRMPGDGGLPPEMDWSGSQNLKEVTSSWPVPRRFVDMDLHSFGYEDHFILPLNMAAMDPAQDVKLALKLNLMVCEKICVPQNFDVTLDIPAQRTAGTHDARIAAVALPHAGDTDTLKIENMVIGPDAIVARIYAAQGFDALDVFVEGGDLYVTAPPEVSVDEKDPDYAQVRVAAPNGIENLFNELSGQAVTLTVTDGQNAIERRFEF